MDKLRHSVIRFKQLVTVTCVRSIRATDTVTPLIKPPGPSIPGFTEVTVVTAFVIFDINTRVDTRSARMPMTRRLSTYGRV